MRNIIKALKGNIFVVLVLRLLLIMTAYSICRIGFYLYNTNLYTEVTFSNLLTMMAGGLKFDISAIVYTNILVILLHIIPFKFRYNNVYQKVLAWIFYIFNFIALSFNMSDFVYYRFTLKRTTMTLFKEFHGNTNILELLWSFVWDYWYASLFGIILFALIIISYRRIKVGKPLRYNNFIYYPVNIALMLVFSGLCIAGIRGGFRHSTRPITLSNAAKYIERPNERAIVLNTPFAMIRTINNVKLKKQTYFSDEELAKHFSANHTFTADTTKKKLNIVVFILESFAKEHIGFYNKHIKGYKGYTPFIDSLCKHSYVFQESCANGNRSINALPSNLASIPSFQEPFVLSGYSGNKINSLGSILREDGYYSAFFHGAPNGSMGFQSFIKQAGFDAYFGKSEYNNDNDFDGIWGIWDEPFLQYYARTMNTFKQPFVTSVFTVSSHHPFKVPEKYEGVFPEGHLPVQKAIGYTDNALRQFFKSASKMPWFKNTVFFITADHSVSPYLKEYNNPRGHKAIPLIVYKPTDPDFVKHDTTTIVQQIDILPTALSMVGHKGKFISFGNDMFDNDTDHFAVNYQGGAYNLTMGHYLLQYNGKKSIALFDIRERYMETNLLDKFPKVQHKMENKIKAIIQEYNKRMIDNMMVK